MILVVAFFDACGQGGAAVRCRLLARSLASAGAPAGVLCAGAGPVDGGRMEDGVRIDSLADIRGGRPGRGPGALFRAVTGWQIAPAHAARVLGELGRRLAGGGVGAVLLYNQDIVCARRVARLCARHRVRFVQQYAELHIAADYALGPLQGYFLREMLHARLAPGLADANIVISSLLRTIVAAAGGRGIETVTTLVDPAGWTGGGAPPAAGRDDREIRFCHVGEGSRRDSPSAILRAFAGAGRAAPGLRLRMVGLREGRIARLREEAGRLGIGDAVSVEGHVDRAGLRDLYAGMDAFILARTDDRSSRACFPTRLAEMMLSGRAAILSDIPDYNVLYGAGEAAFVRAGDTGALRDAMVRLALDRGLRLRIGAAGAARALANHDYAAHGATLLRACLGQDAANLPRAGCGGRRPGVEEG